LQRLCNNPSKENASCKASVHVERLLMFIRADTCSAENQKYERSQTGPANLATVGGSPQAFGKCCIDEDPSR
jgi:hypothetical protein